MTEEQKKEWDWLDVRLASLDEVEAIGHDGALMDGGAGPEGGAWWTTVVDWADKDANDPNPPVGTKVVMADPPGPFAFDDLDMRVVTQFGPGGGWPEVRVMGSFPRLMAFLANYHDDPRINGLSRSDFMPRDEWVPIEPIPTEGSTMEEAQANDPDWLKARRAGRE